MGGRDIAAVRMIEELRERADLAERRTLETEAHIREFRDVLRSYADQLRRRANVNPVEAPFMREVQSVIQTLLNQSIERLPEPESTPR